MGMNSTDTAYNFGMFGSLWLVWGTSARLDQFGPFGSLWPVWVALARLGHLGPFGPLGSVWVTLARWESKVDPKGYQKWIPRGAKSDPQGGPKVVPKWHQK